MVCEVLRSAARDKKVRGSSNPSVASVAMLRIRMRRRGGLKDIVLSQKLVRHVDTLPPSTSEVSREFSFVLFLK